jgi:hypothetical protein
MPTQHVDDLRLPQERRQRRDLGVGLARTLQAHRQLALPGLSVASPRDLEILALSWEVPLADARRWARRPGPVGDWPWTVVSMAEGAGQGLRALTSFLKEVEREVRRLSGAQQRSRQKGHASNHRRRTEEPKRRTSSSKGRRRVGRKQAKVVISPAPTKRRGLPPTMPVTVGRPEPRLRGAQKPPHPLDRSPEPFHPNRPAGWTTTDWINSRS